ncbi:VOC family protein [Streptomyces sp. NRRL S-920]|uniref:VOC family protein n=1 Tax=Streptomyces sp. NRRL S-920 TaxID=1463921 RepID=UPI0004C76375|nr:VOC family protein [Streptomyces sp. NRRL S-920]
MSFMSPGQVVWFEICTTDPKAATDFYGPLLGWNFEVDLDSSVDGRTYTRIIAPGASWPMGAIQQGDTGGESLNLSILSADVHADVDKLTALGAQVLVPATAVGEVTVFARLVDPRGNALSLFSRGESAKLAERARATEEHMEQTVAAPQPGAMARFEIGTTDAQATRDFYAAAFGWRFERGESADGTPYFDVFTGAQGPSGGLRDYSESPEGVDYVMPCFLVSDAVTISTAAERAGARVEYGPATDPEGLVFSRVLDPRGTRFGLFSPPVRTRTP